MATKLLYMTFTGSSLAWSPGSYGVIYMRALREVRGGSLHAYSIRSAILAIRSVESGKQYFDNCQYISSPSSSIWSPYGKNSEAPYWPLVTLSHGYVDVIAMFEPLYVGES